jgi:SSS family solute:Na+ symporter
LNPEHVKHIALSPLAKDMAVNMFGGLWSLLACMSVTIFVSLLTRPKPESELKDLVYGLTPLPEGETCAWYERPVLWAGVVGAVLIAVNIVFW